MSACIEHSQIGNKKGYACYTRQGKSTSLHRKVYAEANGLDVFFKGGVVMHSCDNPRCINPKHLSLGTTSDNIKDCVSKGRANRRSKAEHQCAVLTEAQVKEARTLYIPYHKVWGNKPLALKYGVSISAISQAILGKTWK